MRKHNAEWMHVESLLSIMTKQIVISVFDGVSVCSSLKAEVPPDVDVILFNFEKTDNETFAN